MKVPTLTELTHAHKKLGHAIDALAQGNTFYVRENFRAAVEALGLHASAQQPQPDLVTRLRSVSGGREGHDSPRGWIAEAAARIEALAARVETVRNATLEEAAKVADNWLTTFGDRPIVHVPAMPYASDAVRDIASAIRALAPSK